MLKAIGAILLSAAVAGCSSSPSPSPIGPWAVTSVSPVRGSTAGGTPVTIIGSGFQSGTTVTIRGVRQVLSSVSGNTALYLTTTAQDTGVAEIVVTGPGQAERFATAFEFAPPQTFDFNGSWEGVYHDNDDIQVVISSNVVARVTCANIDVTLPAPLLVNLGAFSATAGNGVEAVSGRIVSDQIAIGEIDTPACRGTWKAFRK